MNSKQNTPVLNALACLTVYFPLLFLGGPLVGVDRSSPFAVLVVAFISAVIALPASRWIQRKWQGSGRPFDAVD